ncbi:MAG: hypothetical protein ACLP01_27530 [Solirubrobacteraceae bacterium]
MRGTHRVRVAGGRRSVAERWQPVISDTAGAIGHYETITQPSAVTGVVALLPTIGIPAAGTGVLAWDASADTLSWRGGPPVTVDPLTSATYTLPEPNPPGSIIVTVTGAALPAGSAADTLTVTSSPATAGLGDLTRDTARAADEFDGNMYVGLGVRDTHDGEVWRSADGVNWVQAALPGFGQPAGTVQHIDSFIVYDGQLYAGTDTGQIWRTSDGSRWTLATVTPGFDANVTAFADFNGQLYANQANSGPGGVFSSPDGTSWSNVLTFDHDEYAHYLQVFNGSLFSSSGSYDGILGPGAGEIWSSSDGTTWQPAAGDGFGDPDNTDVSGLAVFGGDLYAATFNSAQGAQVWRTSDGQNWQMVATNGFGDPDNTIIHELIVFDNELYAGTEDDVQGGEIWRIADGTDWSLANVPGFGTGKFQRIRSFFELGGYLYANGENDCETNGPPGCQERGWELWRLEAPAPTCTVTAVLRAGVTPGFTGAYDEEEVTVQAPGGLTAVGNIYISNGIVFWPIFDPGTTSPIVVTAIKGVQGVSTTWSFDATDVAGQETFCG